MDKRTGYAAKLIALSYASYDVAVFSAVNKRFSGQRRSVSRFSVSRYQMAGGLSCSDAYRHVNAIIHTVGINNTAVR